MQRAVMQRMLLGTLAIAFLVHSAGYGQSLGDVARENREKQNAEDATPAAKPRVITNKDLPKDPNPDPGPNQTPPSASANDADRRSAEHRLTDQRLTQQRLTQQRAADQWKRQILAQKNKMAALQARIDQLKASMYPAGSSVQYDTLPYQARQLQRVSQVQQQLDEQKRKLAEMQEAARHAGLHTAVYDP
jgi:hypothetical protein